MSENSRVEIPVVEPRLMPMEALYLLGVTSHEEGFVDFLFALREDGFVLWQPEDNDLSLDEWEELANSRVRTLVTAWELYKEKIK